MSNPTRKGGFKWVRSKYVPQQTTAPIMVLPVTTGNTAIYSGDAVKLDSSGTIVVAAAGDTIYGVFESAEQYYDSAATAMRKGGSLPSVTWSGSGRQSRARVIPARGQIFRITADDATTATTQAAYELFVGENCEWIAATATGDQSGAQLDISTHNTTNTLSVKIENVVDKELTDFAATGVELEVSFNLIQSEGSGTTTGT